MAKIDENISYTGTELETRSRTENPTQNFSLHNLILSEVCKMFLNIENLSKNVCIIILPNALKITSS